MTFIEFWWYNGKWLVYAKLAGIVISLLMYSNNKEGGWWFPGILLLILNIIYFIGMYISWRKRPKSWRK